MKWASDLIAIGDRTSVQPIRILLADDHVLLREGLATLLNLQPDMRVVAQAGTGRKAVDLYRKYRPDIGLIDIEMPDGDGAEAVSVIRTFDAGAKLVMLTTYVGEEDVFRAISGGARGYLLKDEAPETLFSCIRKVAAGDKHLSNQVAEKIADRIVGEQLSDREMSILKQLALGKPNLEIARATGITESTVKFHMNNILAKLHVADRTQAVLVALKRGLFRIS